MITVNIGEFESRYGFVVYFLCGATCSPFLGLFVIVDHVSDPFPCMGPDGARSSGAGHNVGGCVAFAKTTVLTVISVVWSS